MAPKHKQPADDSTPSAKKQRVTRRGSSSRAPPQASREDDEVEEIPPPPPQPQTPREPLQKNRFLAPPNHERLKNNANRSLIKEREVQLLAGDFQEIQDEIVRRKWQKLTNFPLKVNEEVVHEFYANAIPRHTSDPTRRSWVRGCFVYYDALSINRFLANDFPDPNS